MGNTTSQVVSTRAGTITTTYAFDTANQLQSASSGGLAWRYSYALNGSLVEVTPKGSLNGAGSRAIGSADRCSGNNSDRSG